VIITDEERTAHLAEFEQAEREAEEFRITESFRLLADRFEALEGADA
jgi:hypothetical protein